ncbi:hypothetical protein L6452_41286 [Arctium lappa]|uniref:Uncharacterized protein n=1 Tax=Arctium lappa TaxID=4217 RepID=A0ACB8XNP9_ARCLA|nr:hypothetical protein L6452_41286 [Arctium lappa]
MRSREKGRVYGVLIKRSSDESPKPIRGAGGRACVPERRAEFMECLSKEAQMRVQDPITGDGRRVRQDDAERASMHATIAALQEENEAKQTVIEA